jgi:hypothetical protein
MKKIYYNEDGWVCERFPYDIKITDKKRFIEVDEITYNNTMSCEVNKSWRVVDRKLIVEQYQEASIKDSLLVELQEITNWFLKTDYIPNKVIREEWNKEDERWIAYKNNQDHSISSLIKWKIEQL